MICRAWAGKVLGARNDGVSSSILLGGTIRRFWTDQGNERLEANHFHLLDGISHRLDCPVAVRARRGARRILRHLRVPRRVPSNARNRCREANGVARHHTPKRDQMVGRGCAARTGRDVGQMVVGRNRPGPHIM
jgi:hypothetical protein